MTTPTSRAFADRIGYCMTCVLPADMLSVTPVDEDDLSSLQEEASEDGLSYVQVISPIEENLYLARVAATAHQAAHGYTVLLTERQLYAALPWDQRTQRLRKVGSSVLLTLLHRCAAELHPLVKRPVPSTAAPVRAGTQEEPEQDFESTQQIEVSAQEVQEALGLSVADTMQESAGLVAHKQSYRVQQAFLRAAVDRLVAQLYQGQQRARALNLIAQGALVARVQRWHRETRQQVVNAVLACDAQTQGLMWHLTIGIPAGVRMIA